MGRSCGVLRAVPITLSYTNVQIDHCISGVVKSVRLQIPLYVRTDPMETNNGPICYKSTSRTQASCKEVFSIDFVDVLCNWWHYVVSHPRVDVRSEFDWVSLLVDLEAVLEAADTWKL